MRTVGLVSRDGVAIAGSIIGLCSLPAGWLTLRVSRVSAGTSVNLWHSLGLSGTVLIVLLWGLCIAFSLRRKSRTGLMCLGITANVILATAILLLGPAATRLLAGQAPYARVSLGAGFWIAMAGAYIVILAVRRSLTGGPLGTVFAFSGLTIGLALLLSGWLNNLSIVQEYMARQDRFTAELARHVLLFAGSVAIGTLIAVPVGIWAVRHRRAERPVFFIANVTQTVPSLALFGLLIAPLSALSFAFPVLRQIGIGGIGPAPAVIALTVYSTLPILQNTYTGLRHVDSAVVDAGLGIGMARWQVFRKLEAPLAAPIVMQGIRIASVQAVGNTVIAALIGAGGLGWFVFEGLAQAAPDLILLGAIPIVALAVGVDALMRFLMRVVTPKPMRGASA